MKIREINRLDLRNFKREPKSQCEHLVHFYEDENIFLDTLEGFVIGGLRTGESVIAIATPAHLDALTERIYAYGADVAKLQEDDHFICLDANELLAKFMVNGWPDKELFTQVVQNLLGRARKDGRNVRAFGEMVALMWAKGQHEATVELERLWHSICHEESFSLFCGYPRKGFTNDHKTAIKEICAAHSRVIENRGGVFDR